MKSGMVAMAMRVKVDPEICQGHGLCYFAAGELFRLRDDDGRAEVLMDTVPEAVRGAAIRAAAGCPERAITVEED